MIRLEQVGIKLSGRQILQDVNLHIETGDTTVIMGLSGSGKTTLLKTMSGLLKPSSGEIYIDNTDITKMGEDELNKVRHQIGVVFQYGALFDSLTVYENVSFALTRHTKLNRAEINKIVEEKLAIVGLPETENMLPAQLSGGMQKRVGLARAIAMNPRILLYDEPTSGLDPVMTTIIDNLIVEMHKNLGVTSVVISHDIKSIMRIATKIAMIYDGTLIAYGTPNEIRNTDDLRVKQFIEGNIDGPIKPGVIG
ncbi:MAG: ABC transporter ATP-binding protein [Armatimonadota bacterium]